MCKNRTEIQSCIFRATKWNNEFDEVSNTAARIVYSFYCHMSFQKLYIVEL